MGCSTGAKEGIEYAARLGVYTIMTDYYPPERNLLKSLADEYWMIDVSDIDTLESKCRSEGITGIFASTNEFCLDQTKELCRRLKMPFYASDEGWAAARDKQRFKELCKESGLSVPEDYAPDELFKEEKMKEIQYPVIVKPADSCAQQGLALCWNEEELRLGYARALSVSPKKRVLIEEYILGDELDAFYFISDGRPILTGLTDKYFMKVNDRRNASFQPGPSRFYSEYTDKLSDKIEKLFHSMSCRQGNAFLQVIRRDGEYYFLEMGYRIDGIGTWVNTKPQTGFSNVELMVDLALGRKPSYDVTAPDAFRPERQNNATYLFWAKPGQVAEISGLEEVKRMEGVTIVVERFHEGDVIPKADSMYQIAYYIGITGENQRDLVRKLTAVNECLHLYDKNGEELLTPFQNYDILSDRWKRGKEI